MTLPNTSWAFALYVDELRSMKGAEAGKRLNTTSVTWIWLAAPEHSIVTDRISNNIIILRPKGQKINNPGVFMRGTKCL